MKIATNLAEIQAKITLLEAKYHRTRGATKLLAVTKTRTVEEISLAINHGQRHFGENYCQEAIDKIVKFNNPDLTWHFIGPVQSNKTSQIARNFDWVHTIDRIKIARRLHNQRPTDIPPLNICIQVNISDEKTKSGIPIAVLKDFIDELISLDRLKLRGLMTLPAPANDLEVQRKPFNQLKMQFDRLRGEYPQMDTLSMGTTADMEAAIAEGSTIVRIGTAIFGPRNASR